MYRTVALLLILLSSCKTNTQETSEGYDSTSAAFQDTVVSTSEELHDSDYGIYHLSFAVNKTLPRYSLKFHLPDRKIYLYGNPTEDGQPLQELALGEDVNYDEGYYAENPEASFSLLDFNFDGHKDISLIRISGTTNVWFDTYLFDPATNKFIKNDQLSEVAAPQVDSVNQVILFHNNGGMAGAWYTAGVIAWQNKIPVVILEEEQTSEEGEDEVFIRTIRVRVEGQLKVSGKVRISKTDGNKEKQCLLEGEWTEFNKRPNLIFAETNENVVKVDGRNGGCD